MPKKKKETSLAGNYYNYYEEYPKLYNYKSQKRGKYRRKLLWQSVGAIGVFLVVIGVFRGSISFGDADKEQIRRWATEDSDLAQVALWAEAMTSSWFEHTQAASTDWPGTEEKELLTIPVSGKVVSRFGWQKEEETFNKGIIIETDGPYAVKAAYDGQVADVKKEGEYYTIVLNHQDGLVTTYGNCGQVLVQTGQHLEKGEVIGYSGKCTVEKGRVYFEIKRFGEPVDPLSYLADKEV